MKRAHRFPQRVISCRKVRSLFAQFARKRAGVSLTKSVSRLAELTLRSAGIGVVCALPICCANGQTSRINVAQVANGGVATTSSYYSDSYWGAYVPALANDGVRKGAVAPAHPGGWNDAAPGNTFPDWLEIDFSGSKTIDEIDVITEQDNYSNPSEPTEAMTFSLMGLSGYDVQYWNGSGWITVTGGNVSGNTKVWRKITFAAVTTSKIRVLTHASADGYSRIQELEAWGTSAPPPKTNVALTANGGTATTSSYYSDTYWGSYVPGLANDGDRKGPVGPGHPGGWNDAAPGNTFPDWLQIDFSGSKTIDEIDVITEQDNYSNPSEPTEAMTFSLMGLSGYDVQYWNGSGWITVTGGNVSGNTKVWRKITFAAVTTSKIRVLTHASADGYSRIQELEAWGTSAPPPKTNVALTANGGTATTSSYYSDTYWGSYVPGLANDGDRKGPVGPGHPGGWNDAAPGNSFPDWLEIDFSGSKTIDEIDVITEQDNYSNPSEPTEAMTFSLMGLSGYDVQYWNGSGWITVTGGNVSGNTKVWRKITFAAVTTSKIRVLTHASADGYSRIQELEAWGTSAPPPKTNVALTANGGTATTSSYYSDTYWGSYVPGLANDGDRKGPVGPGHPGGWNDAAPGNSFPDWLEIDFSGSKTIDEIDVITEQDNYSNPSEPTEAMTFSLMGLSGYDVQYWNGSGWITVTGGNVSGNTKVWRKITFAAVTTSKIRVLTHASADGYSRIQELEAWGTSAPPPKTNVALTANGGTATTSSYYSDTYWGSYVPGLANDGDRKGPVGPGHPGGWNDAAPGNSFPDWLEIDFSGSKTIDEIDVITEQDNYSNPSEPTEAMTFSLMGLSGYDVQYWNGSGWITVTGGNVSGNTKVWRKITFAAVTTSKIRVLTHASADGYSRIQELEAWGTSAPPPKTNVALTANGGTATTSSYYSDTYWGSYVPGLANDGDRKGPVGPGHPGGWNDAAPGNSFPDWLEIDFSGSKTIDEIDVITEQDNYSNPSEPTEAMTFSLMGLSGYDVQYWNGSGWITVTGGNVSGNTKVWRKITFAAVTTSKIRVLTHASADGYSRIQELEAWGTSAPPPKTNVALTANGGTATTSSYYSDTYWGSYVPGLANDGDRKGPVGPGHPGGWNDAAPGNSFPDWLEIDFSGSKTIDEIDVITEQDNYSNPSEPTEAMTFSLMGLSGYDVQYWNGSGWITVTGGNVSGNTKVWRKITFAAVTTSKIRVLTHASADGYSRIQELEAWGTSAPPPKTNVALTANGGTATTSSYYSDTYWGSYVPGLANDGDRKGPVGPGHPGGWNDAAPGNSFPDWLEIDFSGSKTIDEIDVITEQDNYSNPSEPTEAMTFSLMGLSGYDAQYWNGSGWVTVTGGNVSGNNKVWQKITFAAITTSKIRVLTNASADGYSRIQELEAWTPEPAANARLDPMNRTGAAGEDPLSRNFNWSLPLVTLPGRTGLDLGLSLTYNSLATWLKQGNTVSFDDDRGSPSPGFRLGFPVIQPAFYNTQAQENAYLLISPSGGRVELRQVGSGNLYQSVDSSYLLFDSSATTLRTTDGTQMSYSWTGTGTSFRLPTTVCGV